MAAQINMDIEFDLMTIGHHQPARSTLFKLPIIEACSERRESLISLITRTANAHSLNPRRMISHVYGEASQEIKALAYPTFHNRLAGPINGLGKYAQIFVSVTEQLTGHRNLRYLTMLPWVNLLPFNGMGLLTKHKRWCSVCFQERMSTQKEVYLPLIWSLDAYGCCDIHNQKLDDACPNCHRHQPHIASIPEQSICQYCFQSLIRHDDSFLVVDDEYERWIVRTLLQMLLRQQDPLFNPTVEIFHENLRRLIGQELGNSHRIYCRKIGLSDYALKN